MLPKWLPLETLKWLIATLAIPVALGYVSYKYERAQTERQATEARLRLYTELLSKREEADTGVRKGIFDKVLETYLKPGAQEPEAKLVALELLALNFNDSLDLSPLFWQLAREIDQPAHAKKRPFMMAQLQRITNEVKDRQIEVLANVGSNKDVAINLEDLHNAADKAIDVDLSFPEPDLTDPKGHILTRHFTVEVAEHDSANRRVLVFVTHRGANGEQRLLGLWVDMFDFPLTNFTRISKSERFTVSLKRYALPLEGGPADKADLTLIYFPSSRSGVRDKPFIDEVISDLRRESK